MKKKKSKSPALEKLEKMCGKDSMSLAKKMGYKSGEPFDLMGLIELTYRLKQERQSIDHGDEQAFAA